MAIKTFKPTTPSRRHMTVSAFEGIDKKAKPERSLTEVLSKHAGRNSYGRITVRHRGGGNKQKYRIIDFKRDKEGKATVVNLQYDPNRSANIALIEYEDGERRYILAPNGLKAGHIITFYALLKDNPGVLSNFLSIFANSGANILTINQTIPTNGCAGVTISAETRDMVEDLESMMTRISAAEGVLKFEVQAA